MENNFFQIHWDKFLKFAEMEYNSFKFKCTQSDFT